MGVDRLLDMLRTTVNVTGDAVVATIVARSENGLSLSTYHDNNLSLDASQPTKK
jgi:Na+/H+-dicarboxylate symporter